jgi:hypothetical protein
MIEEMKGVRPSSSFVGLLCEGFAVKELAAGKSSSGLVSMKAERGKTSFVVPTERDTIVALSPFNRLKERSYVSLTGPLAFNIPPEKSLADYFWIPIGPK